MVAILKVKKTASCCILSINQKNRCDVHTAETLLVACIFHLTEVYVECKRCSGWKCVCTFLAWSLERLFYWLRLSAAPDLLNIRGRKKESLHVLAWSNIASIFLLLPIEEYQWSFRWWCLLLSATSVLFYATFCSTQLCHNEKKPCVTVWSVSTFFRFMRPFISHSVILTMQTCSLVQI